EAVVALDHGGDGQMRSPVHVSSWRWRRFSSRQPGKSKAQICKRLQSCERLLNAALPQYNCGPLAMRSNPPGCVVIPFGRSAEAEWVGDRAAADRRSCLAVASLDAGAARSRAFLDQGCAACVGFFMPNPCV